MVMSGNLLVVQRKWILHDPDEMKGGQRFTAAVLAPNQNPWVKLDPRCQQHSPSRNPTKHRTGARMNTGRCRAVYFANYSY